MAKHIFRTTPLNGVVILSGSDPTLLIIGSASDAHVIAVCERLSPCCMPLILDYSKYLKSFSADIRYGPANPGQVEIISNTRTSLDSIKRVWWRRPLRFQFPPVSDKDFSEFLNIQYEFFWSSCVSALPTAAVWYNDWRSDYAVDRNASQLEQASLVGLVVPDTLITADRERAIEFLRRHGKVVLKNFGGARSLWKPTRLATIDEIDVAWGTTPYPIIFQEYVDGVHDYRVTLVDKTISVVEFDTGSSAYPYDVRVDSTTPCRAATIEGTYSSALLQLMKRYRLRYAAIDLRRRSDGQIVFLELNPAGQFLYLDRRAGTDVTGALATALTG